SVEPGVPVCEAGLVCTVGAERAQAATVVSTFTDASPVEIDCAVMRMPFVASLKLWPGPSRASSTVGEGIVPVARCTVTTSRYPLARFALRPDAARRLT